MKNAMWLRRIGKDSELCELRHNAKYTAYAHAETAKRLRAQMTTFDIMAGFGATAIIFGSPVFLHALDNGSGFVLSLFGGIALSITTWAGARVPTNVQFERHSNASTKWLALYEEGTALAVKPAMQNMQSANLFDSEVERLKMERAALHQETPKTINKDYQLTRAQLNETFEEQDWERWNRLYAD